MQQTVIVDYNSGNLHSAHKAFFKLGEKLANSEIRLTSDPDIVARADRIVLPGVGSFRDCRFALAERGLDEAITSAVNGRGIPFFGICVGMQLMASIGYEHGRTEGFNWVPGEVKPLKRQYKEMKIPHMGWNELNDISEHPIFSGVEEGTDVYFVHSYQLETENDSHCIAATDYGGCITAAVGVENRVGLQFHPEKSQSAGLQIIANFLAWKPT